MAKLGLEYLLLQVLCRNLFLVWPCLELGISRESNYVNSKVLGMAHYSRHRLDFDSSLRLEYWHSNMKQTGPLGAVYGPAYDLSRQGSFEDKCRSY